MLTTSRTLLERLRNPHDPHAWRGWLHVYEPWLRDWLGRHHFQPADTDDLLQNILVVVSRKLSTFVHNGQAGAFRAWLRNILVREVRSFWRQHQPADVSSDWLDRLEDGSSEQSRQWDREHDQQVLRRLLATIQADFEPASWEVFRLLVLEDRPAAEVAQRTGMKPNAIYVVKSRILQRLRQEVGGLVGV
jgi:RNA polymerase sigma factor (sigma-70 family)